MKTPRWPHIAQKQNKIQKGEIQCFMDRLSPAQATIDIHFPLSYPLYLLLVLPCHRQHFRETYFENQSIYQLTQVKCPTARRESITKSQWCWPCEGRATWQAPRKCTCVRGRPRVRTPILYSRSSSLAGQWNTTRLILCKLSDLQKNDCCTVDIGNSELNVCQMTVCQSLPPVAQCYFSFYKDKT